MKINFRILTLTVELKLFNSKILWNKDRQLTQKSNGSPVDLLLQFQVAVVSAGALVLV